MNTFQNKWMVYHELQRLARDGKKASQIASYMAKVSAAGGFAACPAF